MEQDKLKSVVPIKT